jgi:hypothetical protein
MDRTFLRECQLVKQSYESRGIIAAVRSGVWLWWQAVLGWLLMILVTMVEPMLRFTDPSQFYFAFFPPAIFMMYFSVRSWLFALICGVAVGLTAGVVARDGGDWYTYVVPNVVQAVAFCLVLRRLINAELHESSVMRRLVLALGLSILAGSALGALALEFTCALNNVKSSWPFYQVMLHWAFGDFTASVLALLLASVFYGRSRVLESMKMRIAS